jgi:hypothetical protein
VDDSKLKDEVMRPRIAKVSLAKPTLKDASKGTLFGTQEDALAFVGKKAKKGEKFNLWVQEEGELEWDKVGALVKTARGVKVVPVLDGDKEPGWKPVPDDELPPAPSRDDD